METRTIAISLETGIILNRIHTIHYILTSFALRQVQEDRLRLLQLTEPLEAEMEVHMPVQGTEETHMEAVTDSLQLPKLQKHIAHLRVTFIENPCHHIPRAILIRPTVLIKIPIISEDL
jgi:hypothetical protein